MTASLLRPPEPFTAPATRACVMLDAEVPLDRVGGKAHTLGRLIRAGVRVPQGFVVATSSFAEHLARSRVLVTCDDGAAARALVCATPLADDLRDEIIALAKPLMALGAVVVRSSAVGEDSAAASFAGQLDSILHVRSAAALEQAVKQCWASFFSDRAVFYRRARKVEANGMGIVVQAQVDAAAAGVMFTTWEALPEVHAPPLRFASGRGDILCRPERSEGHTPPGRPERSEGHAPPGRPERSEGHALVEYTTGLADQLVAGATEPARLSIDRATGAITTLGDIRTSLDDLVCRAPLREAAAQLEHELGGPQDVEWAITADGTLFIVQARPVTAAAPSSAAPRVTWTNANVNENFPDPISPLLYSVASAGYTHYFRNLGIAFGISAERLHAMEPAFAQIIGVHGARMYYNLTNIHAVIRLAPFGDALAASFDSFVGAEGDATTATSIPKRGRIREAVEVAFVAANVIRQYAFIERRVREFEQTVDAFADRTNPARLDAQSLPELGRLVGEFMDIRCHRWKNASLADTAAMVCYGALQRVIAIAYPDRGDAAHTSLLKAIPDVVSNEPVHRLWALSRLIRADVALAALVEREPADAVLHAVRSDTSFAAFETALNDYLEHWGFRCSSELMLTTPSFQEHPGPVIDMLRAYARLDADTPRETMARQSAEREAETARAMDVLRARPLPYIRWLSWAAVFRILLPWTHASIRYRERARLKQALLYSRLRRVALALGERLAAASHIDDARDVFWFSAGELQALASGGAMLPGAARGIVAARAREHAALSATTPPDSFTLPEGEYHAGSAPRSDHVADNANTLHGTTACVGRVRGPARVLREVSEAERLAKGDVLVTKQTDPGWGPVFFLIEGLVIERGGMLSHGAILAREFGIPCVVGVKDATRAIPDGAAITVDGDRGCVHVAR